MKNQILRYALPAAALATLLLSGCAEKPPAPQPPPPPPPPPAPVIQPVISADANPTVSSSRRSIGVGIDYTNTANAPYQFARFRVTAYDQSGLPVKPKKGRHDSAFLRIAGPIAPGQTASQKWTNIWANKNVQCLSVEEVEIIYMDGSIENAQGQLLTTNGQNCL